MFRAKTVFVIGAGASFEVGLPVGNDLLQTIVQLTHFTFEHFGRQTAGDVTIVDALKIVLNEPHGSVDILNEHLRSGRQLGQSAQQALSIDNVIDALEDPKLELVGKLGIAKAILQAEAASTWFRRPADHFEGLDLKLFKKTWYSTLTKLLTENVRRSEVENIFDNIEIINFNYDRCLEQYLPYSLSNYYGTPVDRIREAMNALVVHRPYGMVGRLPWRPGIGPTVGFGESTATQLATVVEQVRTFTEQVEEGDQLAAIRKAISTADRIVFLGFAFHRQNVELIGADVQDHTEIVATAFGISKSDRAIIQTELADAFGFGDEPMAHTRIDLAPLPCADFFQEYWRTLTAKSAGD